MISIDILTLGNKFKNEAGEIFEITSNFSEKDRLLVELTKKAEPVNEESEQLIKT